MTQLSNNKQLYCSSFFQNFFCLLEGHQAAFVCISKNASTYLKNIAIYVKEGDMRLSENKIHTRVGFTPQNGYLIPVSAMPQFEKKNGKILKFAVWRDPVERLISNYKWFLMEKNWRVYFNWLDLYEDNSFGRFLEFVEFELGKSNPKAQDEHIRKQVDYYNPTDVDYIIHINRLDEFLIQNEIPILEIKQNQTCKNKVEITNEQINKIKELYKDDYLLLNHEKSIGKESPFIPSVLKIDLNNNSFTNIIGMRGNMGKVISSFSLYQKSKEESRRLEAESLLDSIMEKCNRSSPLSYGSGLCGVGVGVEYLLQSHLIEGDADDILSAIDDLVFNEIDTRGFLYPTIDNGILGLGYYLYYRLHYRKESEERAVLNLKKYVILLIDWIEEILLSGCTKSQYYETFFILILLHQLNIFNAKVIKLMRYCDEKLTVEE